MSYLTTLTQQWDKSFFRDSGNFLEYIYKCSFFPERFYQQSNKGKLAQPKWPEKGHRKPL